MAWSSFLFPRGPYNFGSRLLALPPDGRVPVAPDWVALHTPGHTAGHVSLFRGADGVVIAGDAVTTTQQESLISVATQRLELNGPPAYFTTDWDAARWSVQRLAATRVETLLSGHGQPMTGDGDATRSARISRSTSTSARGRGAAATSSTTPARPRSSAGGCGRWPPSSWPPPAARWSSIS